MVPYPLSVFSATNVFTCCQYKEGIFIEGRVGGVDRWDTVLGAQWKNKFCTKSAGRGVVVGLGEGGSPEPLDD